MADQRVVVYLLAYYPRAEEPLARGSPIKTIHKVSYVQLER